MFHAATSTALAKSAPFRRKLVSILSVLATLAASVTVVLALNASPAAALCAPPPIHGHWEKVTETRSIEGADFSFRCGDVCLNGVCPRTGMSVRLWGSCHPRNCDWGYRDLDPHGSEGWYRATYSHTWATKHVWIKKHGSFVRVWVWTDFHDGRSDYASNDWLRQA